MLFLIHTAGGIVGLVAGVLAARYVSRKCAQALGGAARALRFGAWLVGAALAGISVIFAGEIGYDLSTPEGPGRVVGIPFFVAFFDAEGSDYVGWVTYVGMLGNVIVWLLAPQIVLGLYLRMHRVAGSELQPR